ncbi:cytochrome P450 [Nocardia sp. NPDC127579]|uniref:cytochrome P450 n=1 Tax=Nocardia sp. NPDC127579 TaxID=3345402 RepID=UPI0036378011
MPVGPLGEGQLIPLYTEEFAADPHKVYGEMRLRHKTLAPVELSPGVPATLVIGYQTAVRIGNDEPHFPADPRTWQQNIPDECPVKPMMEHRKNALRSAGAEHKRYRDASVASMSAINLFTVQDDIEKFAVPVIETFRHDGHADLLTQYALPVTFAYVNHMVGCPAEIGQKVATGMAMMFEGDRAAEGQMMFQTGLGELVDLKTQYPGDDVTSRLIAHSAALTREELIQQLVTIYGAGIEPLVNLISNTLLLMLRDPRYFGPASLTTTDAVNELLFTDPPLANFGFTYPPQPIYVDGEWLPAHQPVVISMAACNTDPAVFGPLTDNRSHIAWGTGPHVCPAKDVVTQVARHAIDFLFDLLPALGLDPAAELEWRPGFVHRSLAALPVVFDPRG